jgi:tRNA G18 (ribose-2'-O)-methylase SpoU
VTNLDGAPAGLLADYRDLTDIAARRRIECDEFFICEGPQALDRLISSGHRLRSVLLLDTKADRILADLTHPIPAGTPIARVDRERMRAIVGFDQHRGVIAAADRRPAPTPVEQRAIIERARRVAVLEGLNDPENLGAIARSARALGIDTLICDPTCIDHYTRRTVRVSMGEILHLPVIRTTGPDHLAELLAGWDTWALTPDPTADDIWTLPVPDRLAVILGAEGPGLERDTIAGATRAVRIPIAGDVDSLNVGNAAAVAFAIITRPG